MRGVHAEEVSVRSLPQSQMRSRLSRIVLVIIVFQAVAGLVMLAVVQSAWRTELDHARAVASLAASRLSGQPLVSHNTYVHATLDQIIEASDARFAVVVDEERRPIAARGIDGDTFASLHLEPAGADTQPAVVHHSPLRLLTLEAALPPTAGMKRFLLLGMPDIAGLRTLRDGLIAGVVAAAITIAGPLLFFNLRLRRWMSGLHELHTAIRRLALDCPITPVAVAGNDEIAYLSVAFNDMAGKLSANRRALLAANAQLEERVAQRTRELDEANRMLQRQNTKLAEVTETALRFTDDVAHEFRTPLTVISECASATVDGLAGPVTDAQTELLTFVMNASGELSELVDDFLDSSKLRAGTLRIERRRHSVQALLDKVWPMLERRAAKGEVRLERHVEPEAPDVFADIDKAGRTLVNLTVNAVKFSRPGDAVFVSVHRGAGPFVQFDVIDHGPGMPPEDAETLFQRFQQTSIGRESMHKGFGLGLNIVHDLVSVNLGQVWAESRPGEGSTFSFTLPQFNPVDIIDAGLDRIERASPQADVGGLIVTCGGANLQDLARRLAHAGRAFDVHIPIDAQRFVLIFGPTSDLSRWAANLRESIEPIESEPEDSFASVEVLGCWPIHQARTELRSALTTRTQHGAPAGRNEPVGSGVDT